MSLAVLPLCLAARASSWSSLRGPRSTSERMRWKVFLLTWPVCMRSTSWNWCDSFSRLSITR